MNTVPQAATPQAPSPTPRSAGHPARRARGGSSVAGEPRLLRPLGLLIVVAVSAVLNTEKLSQNGYANIFYSAAVKSMLVSLHNFLYASSDPGGLVSVDKPPLGLWVQVASAKVFGFAPLSLLLPEAIAGVLTVALLYVIIARRVGTVAAFAGALTLAVFPGFVAVSRDNGVDPLLILLMLAACGTGLRAIESGRWRTIILTGVLVGLAFNTKTLAAVLVVPGIVIGYLVCAPGTISRRLLKLAAGGLAMLVVSFSWIAFVDLTPAAERPYVGSSTNNSELGLTFEYNGFGRVEGQTGGPGQVFLLPGATVVPQPAGHRRTAAAGQHPAAPTAPPKESTFLPNGRYRNPIPFGSAPSPVRLFGKGLGDQAGWIVPFALFGMIAAALLARLWWRGSEPDSDAEGAAAAGPDPEIAADPGAEHGAGIGAGARPEADAEPGARRGADAEPGAGPGYEPGAKPETDPNPDPGGRGGADPRTKPDRRDPRLACLLVLGVWFVVEATVLSLSKGIVHPYYVSALAPSAGAMTGIGAVALVRLRGGSRPRWAIALAALAILGTVAVQIVLLERESWEVRLIPVLVLGGLLGTGVFAARPRLAAKTMALTLALLLVAPLAYSRTTWLAPVEGTFPAAGPKAAIGGAGGLAVSPRAVSVFRALLLYAHHHQPGSRWTFLTVAADTAAPLTLLGAPSAATGGYSGTDRTLTGSSLARLVRRHEARYVILGGIYSTRGGNSATRSVLKACRLIAPSVWKSPKVHEEMLYLFDCAGHEAALQKG